MRVGQKRLETKHVAKQMKEGVTYPTIMEKSSGHITVKFMVGARGLAGIIAWSGPI